MLDSLFKGAQAMSKHSLDLKVKTSIDSSGLRSLDVDMRRIQRLIKATGADAGAVAARFKSSQAELASFQGMNSAQKTAYRKANDLGGSNETAEKAIRNRPYKELEEQVRNQNQDRADQAREQAEMKRQREETLRPVNQAGDYVEQKGLSAISFGLGSDAWSFALNSMHKFMELDSVLATLGRRFRSSGRDVGYFGQSLGFTIQQTSAMAEELGSKTNRVTKTQFQRYAGFARDFGLDPQAAMSVLGGLQQLTTSPIGDKTLMSLAGRAQARGMGEGRFQEYLQGFQSFAQQGMDATGAMNMNRYAGLYDMPAMVFGAQDPRGQGAMGAQFMQGLQGTLTGGGPMQSFLLRAMGFGKEGGPDYITAKKRLEAGIYDSRNLTDLFGEFRQRGMGKGAQFRALESVAGGKLKAWQIEALVDKVGTSDAGFAALQNMGSDEERQAFIDKAMGRYSDADKKSFDEGGFGEMGKQGDRVGAGEWNAVEVEKMQMELGPKMMDAMVEMRETIVNLAETFKKFFGSDPMDMLVKAAKALSEASEKLKNWMPENAGEKMAESFAKKLENANFAVQMLTSPVATTAGVLAGTVKLPDNHGGGGP
jgi:hypothetical protein